ncbi:hypothetical protein EV207_11410 [Scopulibacillus darangshiensis]|uniref:Uncharacterized protein n=1 Tax=Scopulibacillus darangshiensis TaxID=442528 RepID=A0A4R2P423_9BACL|nr:hypothetical protein [Scopulibacillus darangshiensis]TCP28888.1 hypothetical protein EV207_11410 [Scopulibacillus darangshiensis]
MEYKVIVPLIIILIIPICISIKVLTQRKELSNMAGMTITMAQGMNIGLTTGIILGISHPNSIFITTVISMLLGLTIGVISGLPFNTIAVLDGLLSGVMGGMMGAMIGAMVSPEYSGALLRIMIVIYLSTSLTIFLTLRRPKRQSYQFNRIMLICLFVAVFYLFNVSHIFANELVNTSSQMNPMGSMDHSVTVMNNKELMKRKEKTLVIKAE